MLYHSVTKIVFIITEITTWQFRELICHFSLKSLIMFTHEQNICIKTHIDGTTREQTIISRQLFADHVVGSRPMKKKKKLIKW